jgi:outer membrane protein OmpA-like peptidoglycan-associated protein
VPEVLAVARDELGRKWLKQVVVEGFASPEGEYLYNLNLSLQRSQRVLCVLLAQPYPDERALSQSELEQIRDLFLVGGYSFNAAKFNAITGSYDESRRVELRLEFLGIGESRPSTGAAPRGSFGQCALGG